MTVTAKDKTVIKIAVCVLLVLVAWLYGFNTFNEMATRLENENDMLSRQIEVLERLEGGYGTYTTEFKTDAAALLERFPSDVKEEDEILYADSLRTKVPGTRVYYVTTPEAETVEVPVPNREDMFSAIVDTTGEMSMNNYQPDGSILSVGNFTLKKATAAISLQTDYAGLKSILRDIVSDTSVKSIEDIALTYDHAGRILNGAMSINFYALTGTGKEYVAPDAGAVQHGVRNIFGEGSAYYNTIPEIGEEEENADAAPVEAEAENTEDEETTPETVE